MISFGPKISTNRHRLHQDLDPDRPLRDRWHQARRLIAMVRPYRVRLGVALVAVSVGAGLALAGPMVMRYLVDAISPGGDPEQLHLTALALVGIFAAQSCAKAISGFYLMTVGERVVADLRLRLYEHLQSLSLGFFNNRRTGELVSRLTNDVTTVRWLVADDLANSLSHGLTLAGGLALILSTNWRLTLVMLALVPIVVAMAALVGDRLRDLSAGIQDQIARFTTVLEESLAGVRVVKSFRREAYEVGRYRDGIEAAYGLTRKRARLASTLGPTVTFLFLMVTVAILWFGGREVLAGRMSTGQLVSFAVLTMSLSGSIGQVSTLWTHFQQAMGASERLIELLDTRPEVDEIPGARTLPPVEGRLSFDAVSFAYDPKGAGTPLMALIDLSLEVRPGEILALVGPSGAGKSTFINLIPRFYDPTSGSLRIDGIDLRDLTLGSLREQIGIVPQEVHLFGGTVRENLLYGRLEATEAEMIEAARAANAHEFIERLPLKYDTAVGERGVKLSGGQRQRIAIARAILKNPRILLLDEATSALDSESEGLVQEALERLMIGRTSVVIAHRLSTIKHAHRIAVLDGGRLVEIGPHEELLSLGGLYARLYRIQFAQAAAEMAFLNLPSPSAVEEPVPAA